MENKIKNAEKLKKRFGQTDAERKDLELNREKLSLWKNNIEKLGRAESETKKKRNKNDTVSQSSTFNISLVFAVSIRLRLPS